MSSKQAYKDLIEHVENWLFGVPNPEALMEILHVELRYVACKAICQKKSGLYIPQ